MLVILVDGFVVDRGMGKFEGEMGEFGCGMFLFFLFLVGFFRI